MIQLSLLELIIFLFSAFVCGAVLFSFFTPEKRSKKFSQSNLDEELIGEEARRRLRNYDLAENIGSANDHLKDQFIRLSNQVQSLETQIHELKAGSNKNTGEKKSGLQLVSEEAESDTDYPNEENADEDDFLQAKEELELALFKAKRQLSRYQTSLLDHSQLSPAEPNSIRHDEQFRNDLEKTTQLIEQLYLLFQKNSHTSYSLKQMKQRVQKEMDVLTESAQKTLPIKS